jgi:DNA-binding MarR family transcriptional regulator
MGDDSRPARADANSDAHPDAHPDAADEIEDAWRRERPGTPVTSIGVITRIRRLGKLFDDSRRRTLARLGIDAATLDLLSTLRRAGSPYRLSPGQISRRSLVSAGAVSQRLARAERRGLVERVPSAGDRRGVLVTLTETGHAVVERTVDDLLRHEETLLEALPHDQRAQLAGLLRTLLDGVSRAVTRPGAR